MYTYRIQIMMTNWLKKQNSVDIRRTAHSVTALHKATYYEYGIKFYDLLLLQLLSVQTV